MSQLFSRNNECRCGMRQGRYSRHNAWRNERLGHNLQHKLQYTRGLHAVWTKPRQRDFTAILHLSRTFFAIVPLLEYICSDVLLQLPFWKKKKKHVVLHCCVTYSHLFFCPLCQVSNNNLNQYTSLPCWYIYTCSLLALQSQGQGQPHIQDP